MTQSPQQTAADALRHAIEPLLIILNEASGYIIEGEYRAALGTLVLFDEAAADLSAAIRVYRAAVRRSQP